MPPHIKMRHDAGRGRWLILAPERVFDPDEIAVAILKLVMASAASATSSRLLAKEYNAPVEEIERGHHRDVAGPRRQGSSEGMNGCP